MNIPFLSRWYRRRLYERKLAEYNKMFLAELDVVLNDLHCQLLVKELERGKANGRFVEVRSTNLL